MEKKDENTKEKKPLMERPVSRRDFSRIAMTIGLTSTLFALDSFTKAGATPSAAMLAQKAKDIEKARSKKAKYRFRYGAAGHSQDTTWVAKSGSLDFVRELEERTDGEIRVDYLGSNTICGEMDCGEKASMGIIDFYLASTNNAATTFPYLLNLDWGALWQNRAQLYSFCYDHRSEQLWREPMRRLYGIEMLFGDYGLRALFMSKVKYGEGKPIVDTVEKLQATNAKVRTTGTNFGLLSLKLMGVNPVAISYEEVVDAVRQGAIDGADAWEVPFSMIRFTQYTGQYLYLKYCSGNWITGMNYNKLKSLPTSVQETIMEAAYLTQVMVHGKQEAAIYIKAGAGDTEDPPVGSEHWVSGVRNVIWSDEEYGKLEKLISPKYNPDPWKNYREQHNKLYGKGDIFEEMYAVAREVPANAYAIDVSPHRWWKPNPTWWKDGVWKRGKGLFVKRMEKA
jgi:TRAP-type transport system periplasmic protein